MFIAALSITAPNWKQHNVLQHVNNLKCGSGCRVHLYREITTQQLKNEQTIDSNTT